MKTALAVMLTARAMPGHADTLADALATAYATNPDLAAQRALVRQFDEGVPQALSLGRPGVNVTVAGQQNGVDFSDNGRVAQAQLALTQSLYRGGRTRIAVNAAENRIYGARARLRSTENNVLIAVVTAYSDVLRYAFLVELNGNQVKVLERELQASRDRFEVGDLTRTDVAQSDARFANARTQYQVAQGQLATARNAYVRVVGRAPDNLQPVPPLPTLPGSAGQAVDLANVNNPLLVAARFDEAAARNDVQSIERERLPSVGASVGAQYQQFNGGGGAGSFVRQGNFFTQNVGIQATIPLYQAGLVASRVRQAQEARSQLLETIGSVGRQVAETATNAFVNLQTSRAVIQSSEVAVNANTLALEGVKQENQVGTRTVLEVLNAEQELLQTRVNLVTARRDEYVAGYQLLAAVGQAEADALALPTATYDATANARLVRHKWNDFDVPKSPPALPRPDRERASSSVPIVPKPMLGPRR